MLPWNARLRCCAGHRLTNASVSSKDAAGTAPFGSSAWSFVILNRQGYVSPVFSETQIGSIPSKYGDVIVPVAANDRTPVRDQQIRSPDVIRSALRRWRLLIP